jgi:hypothetical protein
MATRSVAREYAWNVSQTRPGQSSTSAPSRHALGPSGRGTVMPTLNCALTDARRIRNSCFCCADTRRYRPPPADAIATNNSLHRRSSELSPPRRSKVPKFANSGSRRHRSRRGASASSSPSSALKLHSRKLRGRLDEWNCPASSTPRRPVPSDSCHTSLQAGSSGVGSPTNFRFPPQRPFTIDKFNQPLNDGNGVLTCRCHVAEPATAMADEATFVFVSHGRCVFG